MQTQVYEILVEESIQFGILIEDPTKEETSETNSSGGSLKDRLMELNIGATFMPHGLGSLDFLQLII